MSDRLRLLVCENLFRDAAAAIAPDAFTDVTVESFPADCDSPETVHAAIIAKCESSSEAIRIFAGPCCWGWSAAEELVSVKMHVTERCHELLIDPMVVRDRIEAGAHPLLPGSLANLIRLARGTGDQSAPFAADATELLLIDSGVDHSSGPLLRELGGLVNLPAARVSVGLGFLRLLLVRAVLEWRLESEQAKSTAALGNANQRAADYALAVDLVASLTRATIEEEAVEHIFDVFAALFAPGEVVYLPLVAGRPGEPRSRGRATKEIDIDRLAQMVASAQLSESGSGFMLQIRYRGETLGILETQGVVFPEYGAHYLNLAVAISEVCGLAIANARKYEDIQRIQRLLDAERERLDVTLRSIGDGVIATDTEARIVLLNRVAEELTGWPQKEAAGRALSDVFQIVNAATRQPCECPVRNALRAGEVVGLANNTALIARDGVERVIADSAAPIRDATGRVLGVVLVFRDVSERERAHVALREANRMLQTTARVIEDSPDMIFLVDRDYRFRVVNPTSCLMLGKPADEIEGRSISEFLDEDAFRTVIEPNLERCFAGEPARFETYLTFPAAGRRYLEVRQYVLFSTHRIAEHAVTVARDITQRKQAEDFREEYLSAISHDLRNPLTSIMGTAQWLQRNLSQQGLEREARNLEAVLVNAKRMNSMVQDLVESTRLEYGQLQLRSEPTDLLGLILDVVARMGTIEDRERIRVEANDPLPAVLADPQRIERVVVNLLSNALKYSAVASPVTVRLRLDQGFVAVSVIDEGTGISADDLPRLFTRYYRSPAARFSEGLGLGLYISRLLVEAHRGQISVESSETGSTFTFTLPLRAPE